MSQKETDSFLRDPEHFRVMATIAGKIAHEFNNFLTPLTAYPPLIKEEFPEGADARDLVDILEETALAMAAITRQLSALSSRGLRARKLVSAAAIVEQAVEQIRSEKDSAGVEWQVSLPGDGLEVLAAQEDIGDVAEILIHNAVEALPGGKGRVTVGLDVAPMEPARTASGLTLAAGRYARLSVRDSGTGVPDEIRDRLFEPFVTTKKGDVRRRAGLGLTVAYRILRDMEGGLDFVSGAGTDTCFTASFPLPGMGSGGAAAGAPCAAASSTGAKPRNRTRVLIVDDEGTIVRLFQMILSTALPSVKIDTASNGIEAVELFGTGHHGVILMDLHMPGMDGYAAFNRIERMCRDRGWEMPCVIFCTGFTPPDTVSNVVNSNPVHALLTKPVGGQTLIEAVKSRLQ